MKKCPGCGYFPLEEVETCPLCGTPMETISFDDTDTSSINISIKKEQSEEESSKSKDSLEFSKDSLEPTLRVETEATDPTILLTHEVAEKTEEKGLEKPAKTQSRITTGAKRIERSRKLRNYASFFERALSFVFDLALLLLISGVCIAAGLYISGSIDFLQKMNVSKIRYILEVSLGVMFFIMSFFYFSIFHGLCGQTIGKMLFDIMVVDHYGEPPGIERSAFRFLGYFISIIPLFAGIILMIFDRKRQCVHDKISGTEVIRV